jgi:dolichol-phosphate mannosyltransferase
MLPFQTLDIIIPVYNEEECLNELIQRLLKLKERLKELELRFIFIDDGSKDKTADLLVGFSGLYPFLGVLTFSRNFGHQIAMTAGIDYSTADFVVTIDADLQDPPEIIEKLYNKSKEGYDIVYAKRASRMGETIFKKWTAKLFYKLIARMCEIEIPQDTGDFRLMKRCVVEKLRIMRERHRFVRGMVPWIGFKSTSVLYDRDLRFAGESKYPLRKMIKFSKDAIFSFSNVPLKLASLVGYIIVSLGLVGVFFMIYIKLYTNLAVPGITATLLTIVIIGGIQIIMIGIVGEYVGRIFEEVKGRPLYIISEIKNILV